MREKVRVCQWLDGQFLILFLLWNVLLKHNRPVHCCMYVCVYMETMPAQLRLCPVLHLPWNTSYINCLWRKKTDIYVQMGTEARTHTDTHCYYCSLTSKVMMGSVFADSKNVSHAQREERRSEVVWKAAFKIFI